MIKKIITICLVPCVMFICISMWGCGKDDEQVSPESTTVKSFKIDKVEKKSAEDLSESKKDDQDPKADSDVIESVGTIETDAPAQPEKPQVEPDKTSETKVDSQDAAPAEIASDKTTDKKDLNLPPLLTLKGDNEKDTGVIYNPEGQIDPFEPLFRARQERSAMVSSTKQQTIRDVRRNKLTPLEKMDISQLKLTAIILGQEKNIAMVQESTGKGHVIKKGTYIGINSGRVVEITKNNVIIEEEVEDLLGKIIVRKRELKLQKPLGEM